MICRLCHAESDHAGASLCAACHRDLATLYWSSGGLRRVDFPRISGAGRQAGEFSGGSRNASAVSTQRITPRPHPLSPT